MSQQTNPGAVESDRKDPSPQLPDDRYPPDERLDLPAPLTFTRCLVAVAFVAAGVDFLRVGFPETGVPYNYPVFVGVAYFVGVALILRQMFDLFVSVRDELVMLAHRTSVNDVIDIGVDDVPPEEIHSEMNDRIRCAFDPRYIVGGALLSGTFTLSVMYLLGVFDSYPYLLLDLLYGAGHGLFYAPLIGAVLLVWQISQRYITDIDILDPDGVGGYRDIGDAIVSLVVYAILLVTVDFVILSSASFIGEPLFQVAAFALYGAMLLALLALTVVGVLAFRRRLLDIRDLKTAKMREQFMDVEAEYWAKQQRGERTQEEAVNIMTMYTMFHQLHQMALWPINLASFVRLVASVVGSLVVAVLQAGLTPVVL